jgi:hypothetical protein
MLTLTSRVLGTSCCVLLLQVLCRIKKLLSGVKRALLSVPSNRCSGSCFGNNGSQDSPRSSSFVPSPHGTMGSSCYLADDDVPKATDGWAWYLCVWWWNLVGESSKSTRTHVDVQIDNQQWGWMRDELAQKMWHGQVDDVWCVYVWVMVLEQLCYAMWVMVCRMQCSDGRRTIMFYVSTKNNCVML